MILTRPRPRSAGGRGKTGRRVIIPDMESSAADFPYDIPSHLSRIDAELIASEFSLRHEIFPTKNVLFFLGFPFYRSRRELLSDCLSFGRISKSCSEFYAGSALELLDGSKLPIPEFFFYNC